MTHEARIRCWKCQKRVTLKFHRVYTPDKSHWEGLCPCGAKNYLCRPGWDTFPIFYKYKRAYLAQVTGYSLGYLSRVASGHVALGEVFKSHCCQKLGETEEALFKKEANNGN